MYRFLRRLADDTVDRGLSETVGRLRRRRRRAVVVAVDGTGLSYNSVSSFFIRRMEQHAHRSPRHRHWLKWVIVVDVHQQILLAQRAHQGPGSDVRFLPPLLDVAARGAPIRLVLADAEFESGPNHQHIRQRLEAESIIPAKRRGVPNGEIRNLMFRRFPAKPYRQRTKIETTFSAVKRKLSSRAPARSLSIQIRQALLLGLAYNLYRLRHSSHRQDVNRAKHSWKGSSDALRLVSGSSATRKLSSAATWMKSRLSVEVTLLTALRAQTPLFRPERLNLNPMDRLY